ncbi:hypothetical protein KC19_8G061300 [Ceratodon purpureus]|uniref:Uncharacterized protein n=1 Tax=Ceratodon purpureus TaxID=3225 RepID=A0A8T0GZF9_CERPU|nr:hypothetical protein KC19_8G061300 [Ceratodon purpureus]
MTSDILQVAKVNGFLKDAETAENTSKGVMTVVSGRIDEVHGVDVLVSEWMSGPWCYSKSNHRCCRQQGFYNYIVTHSDP